MALTICVVLGIWVVGAFERIFNPPPHYTTFFGSLRVMESRLNWAERNKETRIYITGILTNESPIAWKDIEFECRFYDADGVMVDASNTRGSLTIQPKDDRAFRVSVMPGRPTKDYASHKLSVSTARNANAWF